MVAGAGFHSYYIHQGNKSNEERKNVRKKLSFMRTKRFDTFFKRLVLFCVGSIPRLQISRISLEKKLKTKFRFAYIIRMELKASCFLLIQIS